MTKNQSKKPFLINEYQALMIKANIHTANICLTTFLMKSMKCLDELNLSHLKFPQLKIINSKI